MLFYLLLLAIAEWLRGGAGLFKANIVARNVVGVRIGAKCSPELSDNHVSDCRGTAVVLEAHSVATIANNDVYDNTRYAGPPSSSSFSLSSNSLSALKSLSLCPP